MLVVNNLEIHKAEFLKLTHDTKLSTPVSSLLLAVWPETPTQQPLARHADINTALKQKESFHKVDLPITIASREGDVDLILPQSRGVRNPLQQRELPTATVLDKLKDNSDNFWRNPIALVGVSGAAKTSTCMEVASSQYCIYVESNPTKPNYGSIANFMDLSRQNEDQATKARSIHEHLIAKGF